MIYHKLPDKQHNIKKDFGYVHVYTGEGKGKTTAALGLMTRALGHSHQVLMIQFMKGSRDLGEMKFSKDQNNKFEIVQFAQPDPVDLRNPSSQDRYIANQGLDYARKSMLHNRPDLLILDEVNPAIHYGLLDVQEVVHFLDNRHQETEAVLTGRYAHPTILEFADLVTHMEPKKHYYNEEFNPRLGIEH